MFFGGLGAFWGRFGSCGESREFREVSEVKEFREIKEIKEIKELRELPILPIIPSNPHSTHLPQKIPKKFPPPKKSEGRLRISPSNLRHLKTYIVETIFCSKYHRPCPKSHL